MTSISGTNVEPVQYRDVPGFPGYRVGSDGSVWSSRRQGPARRIGPWRRVKATSRKDGRRYYRVFLRPVPGGKLLCRYLHRLVLEVFVGPCPPGMECCHGDGNTANNALSNLRWGTRKDNADDKARHGTHLFGSACPWAKLDETKVSIIHNLLSMRCFRTKQIARVFDVSSRIVRDISRGEKWRHVDPAKANAPEIIEAANVYRAALVALKARGKL
jgi:hypothetical protein